MSAWPPARGCQRSVTDVTPTAHRTHGCSRYHTAVQVRQPRVCRAAVPRPGCVRWALQRGAGVRTHADSAADAGGGRQVRHRWTAHVGTQPVHDPVSQAYSKAPGHEAQVFWHLRCVCPERSPSSDMLRFRIRPVNSWNLPAQTVPQSLYGTLRAVPPGLRAWRCPRTAPPPPPPQPPPPPPPGRWWLPHATTAFCAPGAPPQGSTCAASSAKGRRR